METTSPRPLTSRTRVALAIARGIAAARGDRDLTPTHVAIGIFREGANPGLGALWYAGLSESLIKRLGPELEHSMGEPPGHIAPRTVTIDLTPGEEEILRLAETELGRLGHPYLGTEHLLFALLRYDNAVSRRLAEHGIDAATFETGLLSMLRGDPPPDRTETV